jgi:glucan phosphoethanolaminetransferase (alkaline phosphatase superfamily)
LDSLLAKGGVNYSLSELIGVICYWVGLLITFVVAVNAVGLTIAADLLNRIVLYVPNVVAAIFILILGMFFATIMKNFVQTAANNAGVAHANFLAQLVNTVVIVFAIAIAMEQLSIGAKIIELTITIVLGSLGLGLALAFGLGCKDIVARSVSDFIGKFKK